MQQAENEKFNKKLQNSGINRVLFNFYQILSLSSNYVGL